MMEPVDNNLFEIKPTSKSKRKIATPCPNVYLNPALDLLANDDPMCNTAMEIVPNKKRKRTRSCDIAVFENSALDLGISKAAVNEFLIRELDNVRKNIRCDNAVNYSKEAVEVGSDEPIYANLTETITLRSSDNVSLENRLEISKAKPNDVNEVEMDSGISILEPKPIDLPNEFESNLNGDVNKTNVQTNITNQIFINNKTDLSLSFIDRLALDSPSLSNQSLYLDDDLNESNIMEIKTITIITKKKRIPEKKRNTNPFLDSNINDNPNTEYAAENPFLKTTNPELEYNEEALNRPIFPSVPQVNCIMPRKLFISDSNSTISTVNESSLENQHEYENIDSYRSESPIYENIGDETSGDTTYNKQSKILGYDVSQFSAVDIMNLNKTRNQSNSSNDSNNSKKDLKHQILKASNKLSKKVLKTLKKTFKSDKVGHDVTLNPYEVPRKPPKQATAPKETGIENPALNLNNSDEIELEEIEDEEHQYESIKTLRNTQLNMNLTPLRERVSDNIDVSNSKSNTPGKKVRFDSTLNQEKVITGNSFDYGIHSPGFDAKIDKYHNELENCINEKKFLQQNM